ncbi:hypothetical protein EDB19DRAFT_1246143 [Suillus lakei]|nr:hypothetical protein EDB19DRAFT_1246143 [Suillus lakei]
MVGKSCTQRRRTSSEGTCDHPLIHFDVPHAADVERLFSDMGSTQSPKCCNLSVDTFEALAKIQVNLRYQ